MRTKVSWILTPLLVLLMSFSYGQEKTITGNVTDQDGLPLPGVSVLVVGTTTGTQTDFDGNYFIKANVGQTLRYSYVGQKTTERKVAMSNTINLQMEEDAEALEEVVVVGYGSGKKLGSVVGSVVQVTADKIQDKPSANVLDAMQGKVAGLQIFSSSGEPSATQSIRLHGVGSLSGSSTPLFVLDGIPLASGSLVSLNSRDFESVTVLKDASATSIYGSRAANGVIYITTKKGKKGESVINISTQYGYTKLANTDFFTSVMNREEFLNFNLENGTYSQATVDFINETYPDTDTEWYKTYYKDYAPSLQTDISISGGSENGKNTYFISGSLFQQEGLAYRSDFDRYTLRSNVTSQVKDWMKLGLNLSLGYDTRQTNPYGSNSTNRGLGLLAQPFYSPVDENGDIYVDERIPGWNRYHPNYLADKIPNELTNLQLNPSGYVTITPLKNVTFKSQMGLELFDARRSSKTLPSYVGSLGDGAAAESFSRGVTQTITNTLEYKFNFDDIHNFTVLGGQEYVKYEFESFGANSGGQSDDRLTLLTAGIDPAQRGNSHSKSEYAFDSFFGRLEYNFNNKYFLDGSVRRDGSSRFGADNRYANFWSAGALWKVSQEQFLEDVYWLDELSVRASTGTSGNSSGIGNYQSLALVGNGQYDTAPTSGISTAGNNELSWESQKKTTVGLKIGLFDRVRLDMEYYNRVTTDMLVSVPVPYTTGFANITSNVGSLQNRGIDVALDFDIVKGKDFFVTPYINLNYNRNKVTELFQGRDYWIVPNTGVAWAVGKELTYLYPVFHDVNTETGAPEWYVPNPEEGDRVNSNFDENNVTSTFSTADLQQNTGKDRYPPLNGGFGLNAGYKGFSLQVDFAFSSGKYLINNDRYFFENPNVFGGFNTAKVSNDYWRNPGDETQFPSWDYQFTQFDSRLIEDASFIRMKNISLGYSLPQEVIEKVGFVKGVKFYVVGRNLLTWTKFTGPDPEVDSNLTLGTNPNTKQFTFGVDIKL
ncbi:SusC/RagA family TonB-linked outer membrane protein [Cellulophaga lytica]|uniref:SusC/RagA family TonB-linked outer membrane protein n=1 Tax=Cellulophaga lytica TaxID=979 RepID=UPI0009504618|nr:SusC/RagA family TonB-linked outer membrane protein [Cellulophaga lytica]APU09370.1 SusC/RagA family TonB-linked outer membrane protein [Cellulophaga lytica]MDO6854810.1 SusC/RagA family TonB-linked outer membrane protein [Cellulophaga lytica]